MKKLDIWMVLHIFLTLSVPFSIIRLSKYFLGKEEFSDAELYVNILILLFTLPMIIRMFWDVYGYKK